MVCAEGEKVLSDLDDWGIRYLRRERLVWSGFGPILEIEPDISLSNLAPDYEGYGIRKLRVEHAERLRRFFLSLLWRASVSELPEMHEVRLEKCDEDRLTNYLLGREDLPLAFFPCWLTQHHQVGFPHNQTPIRQTKTFPSIAGSAELTLEIFRFYFDGLVSHFHCISDGDAERIANNDLTVGYGNELSVTCVPWSRSAQLENIIHIARESLW